MAELTHCPIVVVRHRMFYRELQKKANYFGLLAPVTRASHYFNPHNRMDSQLLMLDCVEPGKTLRVSSQNIYQNAGVENTFSHV